MVALFLGDMGRTNGTSRDRKSGNFLYPIIDLDKFAHIPNMENKFDCLICSVGRHAHSMTP